jgi:hypothetical protein
VQFPLSNDEHAAMARYLSGIRKQLQDVSDLFKARYGRGSQMSEESGKALAAVARLERRFLLVAEEKPQEREEMAAVTNER